LALLDNDGATHDSQKAKRLTDTAKVGRKDRPPNVSSPRKKDEDGRAQAENRSWLPGDQGQGGEGLSKGYGGSGGRGTGPSGPEEE
jgi:hypothetical protein